jgi:hypothetical protein
MHLAGHNLYQSPGDNYLYASMRNPNAPFGRLLRRLPALRNDAEERP